MFSLIARFSPDGGVANGVRRNSIVFVAAFSDLMFQAFKVSHQISSKMGSP